MKADRKRRTPLLVVIVMIATLWTGVSALYAQGQPGPLHPPAGNQVPSTGPTPGVQNNSKPVISVETNVVDLDLLVTDEDGVVLGGLKKENFRILDEGAVQTVSHFEPIGAPITIVMLMEYSATGYNYFADKAASWGSIFLNHLEAKDYIALVTYDTKPTVQVDFTRNKAAVQDALSLLSNPQFQEANLYDAMIDTLDRLDHVKGKKAILLISTGANTFSQSNLGDALQRIKESDVTIFSVGLAEAEFMEAQSQISGGGSISYLQSKNELQTFAKLTGGMSWFPRFEGETPEIFRSVATFLRSQYNIGFSPANLVRNGKYHKLKIEIVRPDGSPLIVTNPKGKRQKPVVYAREGYTAPGGRVRE